MVIRSFLRRTDEALPRDTRKPTLNPKPGVSLLFSTNLPHPPHILPQILLSVFPKNTMKRDESPLRRIVKYFTLDPGPFLPQKNSSAYLISRKHSTRNLIQSLTSECRIRKPRTRIMYFGSILSSVIVYPS